MISPNRSLRAGIGFCGEGPAPPRFALRRDAHLNQNWSLTESDNSESINSDSGNASPWMG